MRMRFTTALLFWLAGISIAAAQGIVGANVAELSQASAAAQTLHVSPGGSGSRNGSSPSNALSFSDMQGRLTSVSSSTVFNLAPGVYALNSGVNLRGPNGGVLHLKGGSDVVFRGDFRYSSPNSGSSGLRLTGGNVIIEGIHFENTRNCVHAQNNSTIRNVYLKDISAKDVHSCVNVERGLSGPIENWTINNLKVDGYYRVGVRLSGPNARGFDINGLDLNGANSANAHFCWKGGVQLYERVADVRIANARIVNNIGNCTDYQQGDGIEADDTGGAPRNIEIRNTYVANSGDADLDMKADHVRLYNVISAGGRSTYYNFKFWNYPNYSCERCVGTGTSWFHVILVNATASFQDAQFYGKRAGGVCDLRHRNGGTSRLNMRQVQIEGSQQEFGRCEVRDASSVTLGVIPAGERWTELLPVRPAPPVLMSAE